MSWLSNFFGGSAGAPANADASASRQAEWEQALRAERIPSFVDARLKAAAAGQVPWLSTMTPAELMLARRYGIRPLATVSGTCWYHYGYSWTRGHAEGWHAAIARLRVEAVAAGANAVVDVTLRTIGPRLQGSMDFSVLGTAVRIEGLAKSDKPVIATVPALEFVRLLKSGIVPTGIAVGAQYDLLTPRNAIPGGGLFGAWQNQPLAELTAFWERVRRGAVHELYQDARRQGDGVLAHTHFAQLVKIDRDPVPQFLGRYIVIGTTVHSHRSVTNLPIEISAVSDMQNGRSPLLAPRPLSQNAYSLDERNESI